MGVPGTIAAMLFRTIVPVVASLVGKAGQNKSNGTYQSPDYSKMLTLDTEKFNAPKVEAIKQIDVPDSEEVVLSDEQLKDWIHSTYDEGSDERRFFDHAYQNYNKARDGKRFFLADYLEVLIYNFAKQLGFSNTMADETLKYAQSREDRLSDEDWNELDAIKEDFLQDPDMSTRYMRSDLEEPPAEQPATGHTWAAFDITGYRPTEIGITQEEREELLKVYPDGKFSSLEEFTNAVRSLRDGTLIPEAESPAESPGLGPEDVQNLEHIALDTANTETGNQELGKAVQQLHETAAGDEGEELPPVGEKESGFDPAETEELEKLVEEEASPAEIGAKAEEMLIPTASGYLMSVNGAKQPAKTDTTPKADKEIPSPMAFDAVKLSGKPSAMERAAPLISGGLTAAGLIADMFGNAGAINTDTSRSPASRLAHAAYGAAAMARNKATEDKYARELLAKTGYLSSLPPEYILPMERLINRNTVAQRTAQSETGKFYRGFTDMLDHDPFKLAKGSLGGGTNRTPSVDQRMRNVGVSRNRRRGR
jgi:hypothetical protein